MTTSTDRDELPLEKLPTGIGGFDFLCEGGLPLNRLALVAGAAGSGKTVLALQFLAAGAMAGSPGVFVTFEERPASLRRNLRSLGWEIDGWERDGLLTFVDASPAPELAPVSTGEYDLSGLIARIRHAIQRTGATRVALDSLGASLHQFLDPSGVRGEIFRLADELDRMGVTTILTSERSDDFAAAGIQNLEEFVADTVVVLRNSLEDERRRRTIEVLKCRGSGHRAGQYPFTIVPNDGIVIIPLAALELGQPSTSVRIPSGIAELDALCGGGFFRDSVVLVSGATGTGKTLCVTHFVHAGASAGERALLFGFEESADQLRRNAAGWGCDFEPLERAGSLQLHCEYPERANLEQTLLRMRERIDEFQPQRVAIDSLSAIERSVPPRSFREFVIALTSMMKERQIAGVMTATSPGLLGGASVTEAHISTLTDSIVLLRYVELRGEVHRGLTVLKMRGSHHDKGIRSFTIDGEGMHIGDPFRSVFGILAGNLRPLPADPESRLRDMFAGD